jgi:hypothetical protein
MKIKGLIGVPGSGKSTVMKDKLSVMGGAYELRSWKHPQEDPEKKPQPITAWLYPSFRTLVFGHYDPGVEFPGTDTLSKSCGSSVRQFLLDVLEHSPVDIGGILVTKEWSFLWEGERFMNRPMFDFFRDIKYKGAEVVVDLLEVSPETLARNRAERVQDPTWLRGMETRVRNIVACYPDLLGQ